MRLRVRHALLEQPGIQLLIALELEPRREEALADIANLVLDLAFLPARCRRAGRRLDEMVAHQLQEAAVEGPFLADEHGVDRRLHIVVDAALAGALEEGERLLVGVEYHLLGLARISAQERHPAVTEPHVGDLGHRRHAVDDDAFVAPVELVSLARRKHERHEGLRLTLGVPALPGAAIAANRVVAARVAFDP